MSLFSVRVIWFVFALLILFADGAYAKSTRFEVETKELIKRSDLIVAEKISKDSHGPVAASLTWLATKGRFPEDFGGIDPTLTFGPFFSDVRSKYSAKGDFENIAEHTQRISKIKLDPSPARTDALYALSLHSTAYVGYDAETETLNFEDFFGNRKFDLECMHKKVVACVLKQNIAINTDGLRGAATWGDVSRSIKVSNQVYVVLSSSSWVFSGHISRKGSNTDSSTFVFDKKIRIPRKFAEEVVGPEIRGRKSIGLPHVSIALLGFVVTDMRNPIVNNEWVLTKNAIPFNAVAIAVYLRRSGELLYLGLPR
jgi:hypothetical protein